MRKRRYTDEWNEFASYYKNDKEHGRLDRFDDYMRGLMRDDFTAYIDKPDYQFSAEDIDAENKILASMKAMYR